MVMKNLLARAKRAASPRAQAVCMALVFGCVAAMAQQALNMGAANNAFGSATATFTQYVPLVQKLCYAIAGVVAVVGAISVYIKMNNEEQDVKKSIMMIVGACVFLIVAAQALPAFFTESGTPAAGGN